MKNTAARIQMITELMGGFPYVLYDENNNPIEIAVTPQLITKEEAKALLGFVDDRAADSPPA